MIELGKTDDTEASAGTCSDLVSSNGGGEEGTNSQMFKGLSQQDLER